MCVCVFILLMAILLLILLLSVSMCVVNGTLCFKNYGYVFSSTVYYSYAVLQSRFCFQYFIFVECFTLYMPWNEILSSIMADNFTGFNWLCCYSLLWVEMDCSWLFWLSKFLLRNLLSLWVIAPYMCTMWGGLLLSIHFLCYVC